LVNGLVLFSQLAGTSFARRGVPRGGKGGGTAPALLGLSCPHGCVSDHLSAAHGHPLRLEELQSGAAPGTNNTGIVNNKDKSCNKHISKNKLKTIMSHFPWSNICTCMEYESQKLVTRISVFYRDILSNRDSFGKVLIAGSFCYPFKNLNSEIWNKFLGNLGHFGFSMGRKIKIQKSLNFYCSPLQLWR